MDRILKTRGKIFDLWHILKARIVVAYALFLTFEKCDVFGINAHLFRLWVKRILSCITHPLLCLRSKPEIPYPRIFYLAVKNIYNDLYRDFFREYIAHRKTSLADYAYVKIESPDLGGYLSRIIGVAWLCEKLNLNIKFIFPNTYTIGSSNFFENTVLSYAKTCRNENFSQLKKPLVELDYREGIYPSLWEAFTKNRISGGYGHSIISKLAIKKEIQHQVDQYYYSNIKGKFIGVHYRQTDVFYEKRIIAIESYISYLRKVLDDRYSIFACSDNASFIDAVKKEFSGKVASRDIVRSDDLRSLHRHAPYAGHQQRQDALIDSLVLAKAEMIYTVGSSFIDVIRYINPAIKIISLDDRKKEFQHIPNFLPIPQQEYLLKEIAKQADWKSAMPKVPPNIEGKLAK